MIPALMAVAAAIAGVTALRRHLMRSIESDYSQRFPTGEDGIAAGAHGFSLPGTNGRGLLMLHGSGDSPQSLRFLASRLNARGYAIRAPLLPGHGRSPSAFAAATAGEYHDCAAEALNELRRAYGWVAVVGQSMGGALAASLARDAADVRAVVLLAPYFIPPDSVRRAARTARLWQWTVPYVRGRSDGSVHDESARKESRAYGSFSGSALSALVQTADTGYRALATLSVPTLIINSENDNRIPRAFAEAAIRAMQAPSEHHWVTGCGHVLAVDYCKDRVADLVLDFLTRHAG